MGSATEVLAIASAACFIASALVLLRAHFLPDAPHPLQDAVSDYGAGPHHRYYRAMVVLLGVGAGLLLAALERGTEAEHLGLAFLGAYAVARLAIAFFMTDLRGEPDTTEGRVHVTLAAVAFTGIAFASAELSRVLEGAPGWTGDVSSAMRFEARAITVTAVLTLIAFLVPQARERVFGLVERLLYVASIAWLLTVSVHLATLTA